MLYPTFNSDVRLQRGAVETNELMNALVSLGFVYVIKQDTKHMQKLSNSST